MKLQISAFLTLIVLCVTQGFGFFSTQILPPSSKMEPRSMAIAYVVSRVSWISLTNDFKGCFLWLTLQFFLSVWFLLGQCQYVCMHLYVYAYMYTGMHVHSCAYIYIHTCTYIHTYIYIYICYICTHTHTHIYIISRVTKNSPVNRYQE